MARLPNSVNPPAVPVQPPEPHPTSLPAGQQIAPSAPIHSFPARSSSPTLRQSHRRHHGPTFSTAAVDQNACELPKDVTLEEGSRRLEELFFKFSGDGTRYQTRHGVGGRGLAGMFQRSHTMDFGEFLALLIHLKIVPRMHGGAGHMTKTHAAAVFQTVNRVDEGGDANRRELDLKEYLAAMRSITEQLGRQPVFAALKHPCQLLFVEEAKSAPVDPPDMLESLKPVGPDIEVHQLKGSKTDNKLPPLQVPSFCLPAGKGPKVCGREGCNNTRQSGAVLSSPRRHPLLVCLGCKTAVYCCKKCQSEAWESGHKDECQLLAINHKGQQGPRQRSPAASVLAAKAARQAAAPVGYTAVQRRAVIYLQDRRELGDWRGALRVVDEVMQIARKVDSSWPQGAMSVYNNLGICFQLAQEYDKARGLHEQHFSIAKRLGEKVQQGVAAGNIGNCMDSMQEYDQARMWHETSLAIALEVADKDAEGGCYGNLSNVHQALREPALGIEMKEKMLRVAKASGEISLFGDLNHCAFALGQYAQAITLPRQEPRQKQSKSRSGKSARGPRVRLKMPRDLILLTGLRASAPGQGLGGAGMLSQPWAEDEGNMNMKPPPTSVRTVLWPRAFLADVSGDPKRTCQPRDLSLVLAAAFRSEAYRTQQEPCNRMKGKHDSMQRERKFWALGLNGGPKAHSTDKNRLGKLVLRVVRAEKLLGADADGASDPFCQVCVVNKTRGKQSGTRPNGMKSSRPGVTEVQSRTRNPEWEEDFIFNIWNITDAVEMKVYDFDANRGGIHDFLGGKRITLSEVFSKIRGDVKKLTGFKTRETYDLEGANGTDFVDAAHTQRVKGSITVDLTFEVTAPEAPKPDEAKAAGKKIVTSGVDPPESGGVSSGAAPRNPPAQQKPAAQPAVKNMVAREQAHSRPLHNVNAVPAVYRNPRPPPPKPFAQKKKKLQPQALQARRLVGAASAPVLAQQQRNVRFAETETDAGVSKPGPERASDGANTEPAGKSEELDGQPDVQGASIESIRRAHTDPPSSSSSSDESSCATSADSREWLC